MTKIRRDEEPDRGRTLRSEKRRASALITIIEACIEQDVTREEVAEIARALNLARDE
jgi:alkylhydroperoxidase/carboxymuconolactone decarboxylase family protein YurZ